MICFVHVRAALYLFFFYGTSHSQSSTAAFDLIDLTTTAIEVHTIAMSVKALLDATTSKQLTIKPGEHSREKPLLRPLASSSSSSLSSSSSSSSSSLSSSSLSVSLSS